jgi:hypothetical protein
MKRENLYYAIFALLVIIFCAVTAMRVFAGSLAGKKREKKKYSSERISKGLASEIGRMKMREWCYRI